MKKKIFERIATSGDFNFLTVLQEIVDTYNNQPHRSLPQGLSPNEAKDHEDAVYTKLYGERWI